MPPLTNPQLFPKSSSAYGYRSPSRRNVLSSDIVGLLQRDPRGSAKIPTSGLPSYAYADPSYKGVPLRPGVGLGTGQGVTFGGTPPGLAGNTPVQSYNPMDNLGYESGTMGFGTPSLGDAVKDALKIGAATTGVGTLLDYAGLPTLGLASMKGNMGSLNPLNWFKNEPGFLESAGGAISSGIGSLGNLLSSRIADTMSVAGPAGVISSNAAAGMSAPGVAGTGVLYDANMNPIQPGLIDGFKKFFGFGDDAADAAVELSSAYGPQGSPGFFQQVGNFFNAPRSWIPGVSGTGADATGFLGGGNPGQGITSIGNVLGTVGGLLSLKSFIDDPSLASGLGTLAGAGASGISAFSGLATAAPWLAGAALVASLLGNKKPSNKTGYTSIDLDEFKPLSFGMEGKKYSQENVDQTMKIMEPIIPLIQELEKQYGVDLKGDIQVNYGGRDGLAYNIGNRDVTGFRNRLDYFDGRDQSTRDGGNIYRRTFKGENAGKDFYNSLLGDLETLAKQKQAEGGGIIDLANYSGVRRTPQNISPEQLRALAANVNF
jgi:hypothetical protein